MKQIFLLDRLKTTGYTLDTHGIAQPLTCSLSAIPWPFPPPNPTETRHESRNQKDYVSVRIGDGNGAPLPTFFRVSWSRLSSGKGGSKPEETQKKKRSRVWFRFVHHHLSFFSQLMDETKKPYALSDWFKEALNI